MNTPITKRIHMNAAKKNSIAKQTIVTNASGELLKADADITKGKKSGGKSLRQAYDDALKLGYRTKDESFEDYAKRAKKDPNYGKGGKTTPGSAKFNYDPVLTDPTKGTTVDTSTAYGVRQISRGQKKAARDVRRAKIKLSKLGIQDTEGKWVAKTGLSARQKAKFEERQAELTGMKNTQKRIMDMAKAGVDPRLTARFESGTEMKAGDAGGKPVKDTSGKYQTQEDFENKAKQEAGINLGSTNSQGDNLSSKLGDMPQGDALNKILREDIDKKESAKVTRPVSTVMSNAASQGYSTSSGLAKKYNKPTSMLKKSGMKMGGFGSKTYKK